ncbi:TPA: fimbrial protein StkG [Salmonella enterica]|nr:fimbrial protein StkG [Salmonella enterica]
MNATRLCLTLILLGATGAAQAATECNFNDGNTRQVMSPGVQPVITPLPPGTISAPTQISSTITMELTPALKSSCKTGNDGDNIYQKTDNTLLNGFIDNKATFKTNVPGIYYTLAIYPDGNRVTAWFPPNTTYYYMTASIHEDEDIVEGKSWHARMEIYQDIGFAGIPPGTQFLTPQAGPLGNVLIGDPGTAYDDHPRPLLNMSNMSFNLPLNEPTCALRAPTTVDLGDWFRADLSNDNTKEVSFQIQGTCVNTKTVWAKVVSSYTTPDKMLFTNSIKSNAGVTAAGGVGVQLSSPLSSHVHADSTEVIAMGEDIGDPVNIVNATYKAKLVKTGTEPVTVGIFGTTVTFQISYE